MDQPFMDGVNGLTFNLLYNLTWCLANDRSTFFGVLSKFTHYFCCKGAESVPPDLCLYGPSWVPVLWHVIKFLPDLDEEDHVMLIQTITSFSDTNPVYHLEEFLKIFVYKFIPQVKKFFTVHSKISCEEEDTKVLIRNENLAVFYEFIRQVLSSEANGGWKEENRFALLMKEIKYLVSFLGDIPFQCTQLQNLQILLDEFEVVANEAGSFTYNLVLATRKVMSQEFDDGRDALLQKIELLNVMIKEYCIQFSELIPMLVTPKGVFPIDTIYIVDSLLEDLENLINKRVEVFDDDTWDQIETIYEELRLSRMFLKDIRMPQETGNDDIRECFITIRDIAYEAEYLVNCYIVENIPNWYLKLRLPAVTQKLKLNGSRRQIIKKGREFLRVTKASTGEKSFQPMETTTTIEGFKKSKTMILGDIIGGQKDLTIISLIGMPGLGKTTIAKELFDDSSVRNYFDRRAWCVISQIYEKRKVFLEILMILVSKDEKEKLLVEDDECLGLNIYQSLMGRRYLIIIDDIWNSSVWDDIRRYFPDDNNGSRIMFTSRIKEATPNESIFHTLPFLSELECLDLLVKKVFSTEPCPPQLQTIGERIARKSHGLPLSIVVVAGILANSDKQKVVWEKVERHLDSLLFDGSSGCGKILEYSYEDLPNHLKMCYLYLGTFPEDTDIPVQKIIWLWIAERLIPKEEGKSMDEIALEYLYDLVNRSLVLITKRKSDGGIKSCGIHDLLREMCLKKAIEEKFMKFTKNDVSIYERRLRVTWPQETSKHSGLHCRSFSGHFICPQSCVPQMPLLRVMDLLPHREMANTVDIPIHFRYLSVSQVPPYQIASNLVNLEILIVHRRKVKIWSSVILNMVRLRHLKVQRFELEVGEDIDGRHTTNLQSLSNIYLINSRDDKILSSSPNLQHLKCECDDRFPNISSLTKLESLNIRIHTHSHIEWTNVDFPSTIKKLTLQGIDLPWNGMSIIGRLPNLQVLKLFKGAFVGDKWVTRDGEFLKLRFLKLDQKHNLEQWITYSEHFPLLQCLVLKDCSRLNYIPSDLGNISTLQKIEVHNCSYNASISAIQIEEEQLEYGNEELKVIVSFQKRSKEQLLRESREKIEGQVSDGQIEIDL